MNKKRTSYDKLLDTISKGRQGKNVWIPLAIRALSPHIGLGRNIYTVIGGDSGSGKSSLTFSLFGYFPYLWWERNKNNTDIKLKIRMRSMERSKEFMLARLTCLHIFLKHNILMDAMFILGQGQQKSRVPDDVYQMIVDAKKFFDEMEEVVEIIDGAISPSAVHKDISRMMKYHGDIFTDSETKQRSFIPNDRNTIIIYVIDHVGRATFDKGISIKKSNIDKLSAILANARDFYGMSPVAVQQFNRSIQDTSRRVNLVVTPEPRDLKDTNNTYEDCDICLGIFDPYRYHMKEYMGYNIGKMVTNRGDCRFRGCRILKNTYGINSLVTGLQFIGECGFFRSMKLPTELSEVDYRDLRDLPNTTKLK